MRTRVLLSMTCGFVWLTISIWLAQPWIRDLSGLIGPIPAWGVITGIALIPGYMNAQLLAAVMMDRPRRPIPPDRYPDISVIIAAYNEEAQIARTVQALTASDYPANVEVVIVDDGSTDQTARVARGIAAHNNHVRLVRAEHGGKAQALNTALATVRSPLVATVDADTTVSPHALQRAVARLLASPPDTAAVAGSLLAANAATNTLTRIQRWDYLVGIASVKRAQALQQGTLVAQGAFSVYRPDDIRAVGGWPESVGEDILLTWALLRNGRRIGFEPTAVAFTEIPRRFQAFVRQRKRWARGMIEGLRTHGGALLFTRRPLAHGVWIDQMLPFLDLAYTLAVPAGIALALAGHFWIIGPMTLAVLPINLAVGSLLFARQRRAIADAGITVRMGWKDVIGLGGFVFLFQLIVSPVSLSGYGAELLKRRKRW